MGAPNIEDRSVELENARAANARSAEEAAAAKRAADEQAFAQRVLESFNAAKTSANSYLVNRGLDPSLYMQPVEDELSRVRSSIPTLDPNPGSYFSNDLVSKVLNQQQDLSRIKNTNTVNTRLTSGFEKSKIADEADDPLIDKIVGEEYANAKTGIDAAYKRGNLNDAGYNFATGELDKSRGTAKSTVAGLGDAVLARYRSDLTGIRDRALTDANSYTIGGPSFNFDPYLGEINSKAQADLGNLEGDLRGATGNETLFNTNDIMRRAGGAQGPINPRMNSPETTLASVLSAQRKKNTTGQGVGSGGAF